MTTSAPRRSAQDAIERNIDLYSSFPCVDTRKCEQYPEPLLRKRSCKTSKFSRNLDIFWCTTRAWILLGSRMLRFLLRLSTGRFRVYPYLFIVRDLYFELRDNADVQCRDFML